MLFPKKSCLIQNPLYSLTLLIDEKNFEYYFEMNPKTASAGKYTIAGNFKVKDAKLSLFTPGLYKLQDKETISHNFTGNLRLFYKMNMLKGEIYSFPTTVDELTEREYINKTTYEKVYKEIFEDFKNKEIEKLEEALESIPEYYRNVYEITELGDEKIFLALSGGSSVKEKKAKSKLSDFLSNPEPRTI